MADSREDETLEAGTSAQQWNRESLLFSLPHLRLLQVFWRADPLDLEADLFYGVDQGSNVACYVVKQVDFWHFRAFITVICSFRFFRDG